MAFIPPAVQSITRQWSFAPILSPWNARFFTTTSTREIQLCARPATQLTCSPLLPADSHASPLRMRENLTGRGLFTHTHAHTQSWTKLCFSSARSPYQTGSEVKRFINSQENKTGRNSLTHTHTHTHTQRQTHNKSKQKKQTVISIYAWIMAWISLWISLGKRTSIRVKPPDTDSSQKVTRASSLRRSRAQKLLLLDLFKCEVSPERHCVWGPRSQEVGGISTTPYLNLPASSPPEWMCIKVGRTCMSHFKVSFTVRVSHHQTTSINRDAAL